MKIYIQIKQVYGRSLCYLVQTYGPSRLIGELLKKKTLSKWEVNILSTLGFSFLEVSPMRGGNLASEVTSEEVIEAID